ncbi:MAG: hypothetical protein JRF63_04045 [Deltaproteobacteria bacterium]|nr:hypothetical protein [Deltaproteobacteria bacterium]
MKQQLVVILLGSALALGCAESTNLEPTGDDDDTGTGPYDPPDDGCSSLCEDET